jgi:hypothetical protein
VEGMGHLGGAREIHSMAYELAVALGSSGPAVDAACFLGRVSRKLTRRDDAIRTFPWVPRGCSIEGDLPGPFRAGSRKRRQLSEPRV